MDKTSWTYGNPENKVFRPLALSVFSFRDKKLLERMLQISSFFYQILYTIYPSKIGILKIMGLLEMVFGSMPNFTLGTYPDMVCILDGNLAHVAHA